MRRFQSMPFTATVQSLTKTAGSGGETIGLMVLMSTCPEEEEEHEVEEEGQVEDVEGHGCQEGVSLQKEETKEKNLTYLLFHHELEPFCRPVRP